jgi:transglutaminase-like putative cysteine protease
MKAKLLFVFAAIIFLLIRANSAYAQKQFDVTADVLYEFSQNGSADITHNISIKNLEKYSYASSYKLLLKNTKTIDPVAFDGDRQLSVIKADTAEGVVLQVDFDEAAIGAQSVKNFSINYKSDDFAIRTGEVWELSIPRLHDGNNFDSYRLTLKVPKSLGERAYISPDPIENRDNLEFYQFIYDKESLKEAGVTAGFGEFQFFTFTISYHLENPLNKQAEVEIALPPDTSIQKMFYDTIKPVPESVRIDQDGNWLAKYTLNPRQRVDVVASGDVQIFATPRSLLPLSQEAYLNSTSPTKYWQSDDNLIKELAGNLKTPENIYEFVVEKLNYDYQRVRPNVDRLGAVEALANPNNAICMEFTDLFIALARSAGIPAKEANGFAYTDNSEVKPLSLVADVLHSWPEYWDNDSKTWIPIDPTWGDTTGGVDYFNKLDLRHFTFAYHGKDPTMPYPPGSYKLGPNPQKDIFVNFGEYPEDKKQKLEIYSEVVSKVPLINKKVIVRIRNTGSSAIYNLSPQIEFDDKIVNTMLVDALVPYSVFEMETEIPFSLFARKTPNEIKITASESEVVVKTNKQSIVIQNILVLFLTLLFAFIAILYKLGRIKSFHLFDKISGIWMRLKNTLRKIFIR